MIIPRTHNYLVFTFFLLSFLLLFQLNPLSCIYPFNLLNHSTTQPLNHLTQPLTHSTYSTVVYASDEPFTGPANWGGTGLMEIPTARVMKENRYRVGFAQVHPYRYYYLALSPIKGLEIDGRITEIRGVPALTAAYGNYKDKALDVKYQFIEEGKYSPAITLGIMDPQGTRLYPSQFIVASKQIYPFDFTLGFGNGRFGKRSLPSSDETFKAEMFSSTKSWLKDSQFFWGLQFAPSDKYALMVEYSPIRYHKQTSDPAQAKYFQQPVPSKFNYGLRWKPLQWTEIDMSYQRGNQVGFSVAVAFDIGQPLVPIYDHPYKEKKGDSTSPLARRLVRALYESGFSNIAVTMEEKDLWVEAQNDKYYYSTKAIGVILTIINDITPRNIEKIHIVLSENKIPIIEFTTAREDITEFYAEKLTLNEFFYLSKVNTDIHETPDTKVEHKSLFKYGIKPSFQTFLNDPSGFFKYRLGIAGWVSYHPWTGASFVVGPEGYPLNNISTSNVPSADPIRTDVVLYKKKDVVLGRLMYDQIYKMKHELYGRVAAGLLEVEYAGLDGEVAMPVLNGRLMVGLSGSLVRKRDPDKVFQLKEDIKKFYKTAFFNTRLNIPEYEISIDVKTGRFLGGDKGSKVTVSKFIHGVILSAWYSFTDTSVFKDTFNRGYHDKGVALVIPLRLFKGADTKTSYNYALSPWTRDVAQDIDHYNTLFEFFNRNTEIFLDKDKTMIYK